MPRPRPNFETFKYLFYGLNYKVSNTDNFNVNTAIDITCINGHNYKTSITKIKSLNQSYKECPHCKKQQEYQEMGIEFKVFDEYAKKYNFEIVNKKDFYNRWEESIIFKCNKHDFKIERKSLFHLERNLVELECEECKNEKLGIVNDDKFKDIISNYLKDNIVNNTIFYFDETSTIYDVPMTDSLKNRLKEQNRWYVKRYIGAKSRLSEVICKICGYEKKSNLYDLLLNADRTGCISCKQNKFKNSFLSRVLEICDKNKLIPINLDNKQECEFKCNKCGNNLKRNCTFNKADDFQILCPTCHASTKRKSQNEVCEYIKSIYTGEVSQNNKQLIAPYEVDIYLPEKKLAIEYCGNIWHSTRFCEDTNKHKMKYEKCLEQGIRLVTMFEDEWIYNRPICESRISNLLGLISNRIFARKCEIKEIESKVALSFCKEHHIQGEGSCSIGLGLYYENELVSVMTFSRPSISKSGKDYDWELNRFCSKVNYSIIGGASKLLSYFRNMQKNKQLITFCDLRWGNGGVYENLGFEYVKTTRPNYYYIGNYTDWKRKHRFSFAKYKLLELFGGDSNKTELQLAEDNGLYRIYDCGHKKYKMLT